MELIGNIEDLHHREYVDLEHLEARSGLQKPEDSTVMLTENSAYALKTLQQASVDQQLERRQQEELRKEKTPSSKKLYLREYQICENLRITDLERVAVIGQGGFGRVELSQEDRIWERAQVAGTAIAALGRTAAPGSDPTEWECHNGHIKKEQLQPDSQSASQPLHTKHTLG
ncbi:unnamed protein product [Schistocephalus solidus]|uniref:Protein kinase domain-containing protein n=1 Tax=Schistocephalus solidus TaxID=70667 RepID=A0A3P7DLC1_SCHSO|nr:unnamed protein product [Schistocephalus solidus]